VLQSSGGVPLQYGVQKNEHLARAVAGGVGHLVQNVNFETFSQNVYFETLSYRAIILKVFSYKAIILKAFQYITL